MGLHHSPRIVTDGLMLCIDAANSKSYSGTGTVLNDISGSGITGDLDTAGFDSANNGSFSYNGIDGESLIEPVGDLGGQFTVDAWAYPISYSGSACIIADVYPGNNRIQFVIQASGSWRGGMYQLGWYYSPTMSWNSNTWQHVVYSYDGTNQTIYKNGISGGSTQTYSGVPLASIGGIRLGRRWDLADYYKGKIGPIKIYNRALTLTEIRQNFNAQRGRYGL